MKFKKILQTILSELGMVEKATAQELSDDDWKKIAQSYKEKTGNDFYSDATMSAEDRKRVEAHDMALQILKENEELEEKPESGEDSAPENHPKSESNLPEMVKQMQNKMQTMGKQIQTLSQGTEPDNAHPEKITITGLGGVHTATHAFGIEHPMFDASKRWNKVAMRQQLDEEPDEEDLESFKVEVKSYGKKVCSRMKELQLMSALNKTAIQQLDYSHLKDAGLGEQYVVRRVDALIARIIALPSVFSIFPLRSYIQDKEMITNAFFDEYSQAYQAGEISKGSAKLMPELAQVDDAMFKKLFESMKFMERQYIGYLNTNGSDPTKWGMIEWMIFNMSTVLNNERNIRAIRGCRVEPVEGKNGHYLNGSTGIIYRLLTYIEDFKILPFDDEAFSGYNQTNMVDVVENFVEETHQCLESFLGKAIYLNEKHKPWYKQSFRKKYGDQTDFSDGIKVMNYDIEIVWVPNMDSLKFIFIQDRGNLQCLENVPGEMYSIRFEQRMESVWAYSVWKEGTGAAYSGKKFDTLEALQADERKNQVIFINKPVAKLAVDSTTVNAKENFWFVTASNTKETALTDITGAKPGVVYKIEIGGTENPTSISKSGKFADLASAWTPTNSGAWIKILYDKENDTFKEIQRSI